MAAAAATPAGAAGRDARDDMRLSGMAAPGLLTVGGVAVIVGTFLPWVASGTAERSSYQVFEVIGRLGFAPDGPVGWAMRLWPIMPLLMVSAAAAAWFEYRVLAAAIGAVGAFYAGGVGFAVNQAPKEGLVRVLGAPLFTGVAAGLVLAGAVVEMAGVVRSDERSDALRS